MHRNGDETLNVPSRKKNLFANHHILFTLMHTPSASISPESFTEATPDVIKDVFRYREAEKLLARRKYRELNLIIQKLPAEQSFLSEKRDQLILQYLFRRKQFTRFISYYNNKTVGHSKIRKMLIYSLYATNKRDEALEKFKEAFSTASLKRLREVIPQNAINYFMHRLNHDDWYRKFDYLFNKNRLSEFLRERHYLKDNDLRNLFTGRYHFRRRRYRTALQLLKKIDPEKYTWEKGQIEQKIYLQTRKYDKFFLNLKKFKVHPHSFHELIFNSANLFLVKDHFPESLDMYLRYIKTIEKHYRIPFQNIADYQYWKSIWNAAWIHVRLKNRRSASYLFLKGSHSPIRGFKIACTYWAHKFKKGTPQFIYENPFSYYFAQISQGKYVPRNLDAFNRLIDGPQSQPFREMIGQLGPLLQHECFEEAFDLLQWTRKNMNLTATDIKMIKLLQSIIYLNMGEYFKAFVTFRTNFPHYEAIIPPRFLRNLYFPLRFRSAIALNARKHGLDEMIICALIRNESFFRPHVVSPARANGLMQLLYGTAGMMARKEQISIRRKDLFTPEINIRLGVAYFADLMSKYNGKLYLALAAYNAGDHRVDKWLKDFGHHPEPIFIEMIPFTETRNYVKFILRNYHYYKIYYHRL